MSFAEASLLLDEGRSRGRWRRRRPRARTLAEFEDDGLREALSGGRYGGVPLEGPAANAFCQLLRRLDWQFHARELAGAMLHFPVDFGIGELKTVLFRLGYEAAEVTQRGSRLANVPDTALIVDATGNLFLKADRGEGALQLIDLATQDLVAPRWSHKYTCLVFDKSDRSVPDAVNPSWMNETAWRFAPELRTLLALMLASNVIIIVASLSTIKIFDTVLPSRALDTLLGVVVGLVALIAFEYRLRYIRAHLIARMAGRIEYLLGTALFSKLLSMPLTMLTANSINDQVGRLRQFETVRDFFTGPIVAVMLELPFAILLLGIIFFIDPTLGLLILGLVALYFINTVLMLPSLKRASRLMTSAYQDHAKFLLETYEHRNQIARMGIGAVWRDRCRPKTRRLVAARAKLERMNRAFTTIAGATTPLATAATIYVGAGMVIDGSLSGGQLIGVTMLSSRLFAPIQQAAVSLVRAPELANLFKQVDAMMRIDTGNNARMFAPVRNIAASIRLDGVSMRYPKAQNPALAGVSFNVAPGELVAVTGHSGAGKSSLLRVLVGLYPIQVGAIHIGGTNLTQLNRNEISSNVNFVSDRPTLIHGTVSQNLLILSPNSTRDDLLHITGELGIRQWIEELPAGFETRLDHEQMAQIPPGIKALISVAQALLCKPPILLLDEAFSGLPPESEQRLLEVVTARRGRQTTILVTQRPSHHRMCDRVFRMTNGQLLIT